MLLPYFAMALRRDTRGSFRARTYIHTRAATHKTKFADDDEKDGER